MTPRLWIVSPSYRDVFSFLILRDRITTAIEAEPDTRRLDVRFCFVDDTAGLDPDVEQVRQLPDASVIEPPFNVGHQRAIVFALRTLAPCLRDDDTVVTLDADGQDRPEDLPRLLAPVLRAPPNARTVALARRTSREEPLPFKLGYFCFRAFFWAMTGTVIRTGNFAAFRGIVAKRLLQHPYFDLCYSSTFIALNAPIEYVPCPRGPRYEGRSRMNRANLLLHGMRMLMPFLDRIAMRALVLFSSVFFAGVTLLAVIVGVKLLTDRGIPGWATSTTLAALLLSLIALASFLILFATFAQSRGVSLSTLEHGRDDPTGEPRPPTC